MDSGPQDLITGESVVWETRIHRIQLLWPSVVSLFLGAIAAFLFDGAVSSHGSVGGTGILTVGALLFLVTALLVAGIAFVNWRSRKVIITDKRLRITSGAFEERAVSIFLAAIESAVLRQGILGKVLGFGTVTLRNRDGAVHRLGRIVEPTDFLQHLQRQMRQEG
jgi:uncharacterized membrane protein YdbT with pleckstrin-like domain